MDAFQFSCRVSFALRKRITRRVNHVIERDWTNIGTGAVSNADIPIYCDICSVDSQGFGRVDRSPNFVLVMFTGYLAFGLKIRVYRQKQFTTINCAEAGI